MFGRAGAEMSAYWLNFTDGTSGSCEGKTLAAAITKAEDLTGRTACGGKSLPYFAVPVIFQSGDEPAFCHNPVRCAGRSSCPMDYACTE
jgi:hypothetical protein